MMVKFRILSQNAYMIATSITIDHATADDFMTVLLSSVGM